MTILDFLVWSAAILLVLLVGSIVIGGIWVAFRNVKRKKEGWDFDDR